MTSNAPTFSPRYRATYVAAGIQHNIQLRGLRGRTFLQMQSDGVILHDIFNNFATQLADDFAWLSADIALTDSDVWNPAEPPAAVTGVVEVAQFTPWQKITGTRHSGRAPTSRASYTMFGIHWDLANTGSDISQVAYNGIITAAEHAGVAANVLLANAYMRAASGTAATWYSRMTVKPNDALLRLVRKGIIT